jgi:GDP-D-mannose dehydratase
LTAVLESLSRITSHHLQVQVNPAFVRSNEIKSLCGSPAKLVGAVGAIVSPTLDDTLRWMLDSATVAGS